VPVQLALLHKGKRESVRYPAEPPVYLVREQVTESFETSWIEVQVDVDAEVSPLFGDPSERKCQPGDGCHHWWLPGSTWHYQISEKAFFCCQLYSEFDRNPDDRPEDPLLRYYAEYALPKPPRTTFLILESTAEDKVYRRVGVGCPELKTYYDRWLSFPTIVSEIRII
jgi:hypothetical protein